MSISFEDLGLGPQLIKAIDEIGYTSPTPIQEKAIPIALQGRDVLGCAQTGTGKTASFTLPMLEILSEGRAKARMPRSLILTPTRELAAQVADNFDLYGKHGSLSKALLIGGVDIAAQMRLVENGVDVLVATPGRLLDVFERGGIMLADIQILVIDEADRMLDMGFIPDIDKIVGLLPPLRQTLFFSATMAPEIRKIADRFLQNPKEITVAPPASPSETVDQHLSLVGTRQKREALRHLIKTHEISNAFVFCNRKRDVDVVANSLKRHGFNAGAIHGDMDQLSRTETLAKFKDNAITILVASDVAARGIDIQGVGHVFNFDLPTNAEDYVHRIGRTGRAGRTGCAYSLATPADQKLLASIEKLIGKEIPRYEIDGIEAPNLEEESASPSGRRRRGRKDSIDQSTETKSGPPSSQDDSDAADANRKPRGRNRRRYRDEEEHDPNLPVEASQLPPFVTIGPDWMTQLNIAPKKKPARKRRTKKVEDAPPETVDTAPEIDAQPAPTVEQPFTEDSPAEPHDMVVQETAVQETAVQETVAEVEVPETAPVQEPETQT